MPAIEETTTDKIMSASQEHIVTMETNIHLVSDSEAESASLCGSELENEILWGDQPVAPVSDAVNNNENIENENINTVSNENGTVRSRTPKKGGVSSAVLKSKRLVNIHPIRSVAYLPKPNELPVGVRKQQRWFNDHHFGNKAAATGLEDLMEHMTINVEWRSNFQKIAEPENKELQIAFRKSRLPVPGVVQPHYGFKGDWSEVEVMFRRIDRRARTLLLHSFESLAPFIEAVELAIVHFVEWGELPWEGEVDSALSRLLAAPLELLRTNESNVRLIIPLLDSPFHRLIVHSVCQFYRVPSRTEVSKRLKTKVMVLKQGKRLDETKRVSLCAFIRARRLPKQRQMDIPKPIGSLPTPLPTMESEENDPLEVQSKSSECSDGYTMLDFPTL